jgi:hypothetical protein
MLWVAERLDRDRPPIDRFRFKLLLHDFAVVEATAEVVVEGEGEVDEAAATCAATAVSKLVDAKLLAEVELDTARAVEDESTVPLEVVKMSFCAPSAKPYRALYEGGSFSSGMLLPLMTINSVHLSLIIILATYSS